MTARGADRRSHDDTGVEDGIFAGPGEMRALCRAVDWSRTALGPVANWPQSLRTIAQVVLDSPTPMFLWWGPELTQIYNDAYRPSLGASGRHPQALGMQGRACWTDIWDAIGPQIEQVMSGGPPTWHEDQYLPIERNGRLEDVWWTYSYSAVHDESGAIAGTLVVCQETTSRVRAEQERGRLLHELEIERTRLATVFQQAPAFLAVFRGEQHVFELANDSYYQLVGHRELIGLPIADALPEVRAQGFFALLDQVLATSDAIVGREVSVLLARTPGDEPEERFVDFVYQALVEADGTRSGIAAHGYDVTEQVKARREVERLLRESERARADAELARAAAVQADLAKSQFLANMSHELRTPLNAIQGYVQLIEIGIHGPVTESQRETLARIDRAQRHLLGLVNDVLNFTRIGAGRVEYDVQAVDVADVVADVLPLVEPQLAQKRIDLEVRLSTPGVADAGPPVRVWADYEKLGQIFLNLLSNAIKFTPSGGRVVVSFTTRADGTTPSDVAFFQVADTGIGIPRDRLDAIFEPFVQVRTDYARGTGGTGLGLSISRDLARGMDGDLRVRSVEGTGSTFTVALRRA
ncbi:MAG: PAS domain-containing protein [Gemmatimonadetes bacterium]|nr:PAS domain-containing protein [Gemmatimonadota bacterium]